MKKYTRILWLLLALPLLFACGNGDGEDTTAGSDADFVMTARITAIGERIEVDVSEGPYDASGPYWVITSDSTAYRKENGEAIARADLSVGDTVEIVYGGQVMMSYPPQIVATQITQK